jgi:hypothetical protein
MKRWRRILLQGPQAWAWSIPLAAAGYQVIALRDAGPDDPSPLLVSELPEPGAVVRERYPLTALYSSPDEVLH